MSARKAVKAAKAKAKARSANPPAQSSAAPPPEVPPEVPTAPHQALDLTPLEVAADQGRDAARDAFVADAGFADDFAAEEAEPSTASSSPSTAENPLDSLTSEQAAELGVELFAGAMRTVGPTLLEGTRASEWAYSSDEKSLLAKVATPVVEKHLKQNISIEWALVLTVLMVTVPKFAAATERLERELNAAPPPPPPPPAPAEKEINAAPVKRHPNRPSW